MKFQGLFQFQLLLFPLIFNKKARSSSQDDSLQRRRRLGSSFESSKESPQIHVAILGNRHLGSSAVLHSTCKHTKAPERLIFHFFSTADGGALLQALYRQLDACRGATLLTYNINDVTEELENLGFKLRWREKNEEGDFWSETPYKDSKHASPLNLVRFYLPHLDQFSQVDRLIFLDDDIIIQNDIAFLQQYDIPNEDVMAAGCQHWTWSRERPGHFKSTYYIEMEDTGYVGNFKASCEVDGGEDTDPIPCVYDGFLAELASAAKEIQPNDTDGISYNPLDHQAFNMGFNILLNQRWKESRVTERFEEWVDKAINDQYFGTDTLAFGLGLAYLTLGGAVHCYDKDLVHLVGLGFVPPESLRAEGWTLERMQSEAFALHFNGATKPWEQPMLDCTHDTLEIDNDKISHKEIVNLPYHLWQKACIESTICDCQPKKRTSLTKKNDLSIPDIPRKKSRGGRKNHRGLKRKGQSQGEGKPPKGSKNSGSKRKGSGERISTTEQASSSTTEQAAGSAQPATGSTEQIGVSTEQAGGSVAPANQTAADQTAGYIIHER